MLCYRAKNLFSLKGKDNKEKRMHIYRFLLDHFTDEQRFNITTKISHSVLGRGLSLRKYDNKSDKQLVSIKAMSPAVTS